MFLASWRILLLAPLLLGLAGCGHDGGGVDPASYRLSVEQWRERRIAELMSDEGWLSYTGSGRLREGRYTVGSGQDNTLRLPSGPAQLGILELAGDGTAVFTATAGSGATVEGRPFERVVMHPAIVGGSAPTRVQVGSATFHLARSGTVSGWRYRDPEAGNAERLGHIDHFPVDLQWRVVATWHAFPEPQPITLLSSIGTPIEGSSPGMAVFERGGRTYQLRPVLIPGGDGRMFFPFTDRTSGRESYGGARYLYAEQPFEGELVLDFNLAQNPPCALTPHVVCPIAPPGNHLELAVDAGEKNYLAPQ